MKSHMVYWQSQPGARQLFSCRLPLTGTSVPMAVRPGNSLAWVNAIHSVGLFFFLTLKESRDPFWIVFLWVLPVPLSNPFVQCLKWIPPQGPTPYTWQHLVLQKHSSTFCQTKYWVCRTVSTNIRLSPFISRSTLPVLTGSRFPEYKPNIYNSRTARDSYQALQTRFYET